MYNSNFPLTNTLVSHAVGKSFNFVSFRYFCGWNRKNGNRLNWHTAETLSSSKTLLTTRLKSFLKKFVKTPAKVWNFWSCRFYCFALPYLNHALLFPWVSGYRLIQRSCESFPKKESYFSFAGDVIFQVYFIQSNSKLERDRFKFILYETSCADFRIWSIFWEQPTS